MSKTRIAWMLGALLVVFPLLHCGDSATTTPDAAPLAEPETDETPAATPTPPATPSPEDLEPDPLREVKDKIAEARRLFESAEDPIDVDVYRVEYVLLLRRELEKLGLPKSALDRMSRRQLEERARRKGVLK